MTAKKIIYTICLLILLPLSVYSQDPTRAPKRRVVLPSGDTIVTSNRGGSSLLSKEDMKFFKRDTSNMDILVDSLYNLNTRYRSLEDAAHQVTNILDEIGDEQEKSKGNESLSVRLSQQIRKQLAKEKEAKETWNEIKKEDNLSVEDMVESYRKFGDKPTFYINGVEVSETLTNQLRPIDILSRQFKVTNTLSKNPNGEIWFEVPIPIAQKLLNVETESKNDNVEKQITSKPETGVKSEARTESKSETRPKSKDKDDKKSTKPKEDLNKKEDLPVKPRAKTKAEILQEAEELLRGAPSSGTGENSGNRKQDSRNNIDNSNSQSPVKEKDVKPADKPDKENKKKSKKSVRQIKEDREDRANKD